MVGIKKHVLLYMYSINVTGTVENDEKFKSKIQFQSPH